MNWKVSAFKNLSVKELYKILQLRAEVFVVEQTCAYQDLDGKDFESMHFFGVHNEEICAYVRIVKPGVSYKTPAIGRVVVAPNYRGTGLGKELMIKSIEETHKLFPGKDITISAQRYLEKFYTELGFETISETYLEDDIPHIKMILKSTPQ